MGAAIVWVALATGRIEAVVFAAESKQFPLFHPQRTIPSPNEPPPHSHAFRVL